MTIPFKCYKINSCGFTLLSRNAIELYQYPLMQTPDVQHYTIQQDNSY